MIQNRYSKYSQEQIDFLVQNLPTHTHTEITEMFNKLFPDTPFEVKNSRSFAKNHKISSAFDGRFKKGQVAPNKGKKLPGMKNSGQFQKGNRPKNWKPVGTKVKVDGFWKIKVAEPRTWQLLARYVWEQHNDKLTNDEIIIFLDGNADNCDISNLEKVSRAENIVLNNKKYRTSDSDLTQAGLNIIRLQKLLEEKSK